MKKFEHKTKDERRRVLLSKNNELSYAFDNDKLPEGNGFGSAVMAKTREVNRRVVALVLAFAFVLTTVVVGVNLMTRAEENGDFNMLENSESGMVMRKGLKDNGDGTYSVRMEAYATKPVATKAVKENTPLDIVLVMDQSASMDTKDVLTGGYYAARNSSFTIDDIEKGEYYYFDEDDGKHYRVKVDNTSEASYVKIKNANGDEITEWTAQEANDWYNNNPNKDNQNLYYVDDENNPSYETVYVDKHDWFKKTPNLSVGDFIRTPAIPGASSAFYVTNNQNRVADYYYNSNSNSETPPSWHLVYYNSHGFWWGIAGGYELVLWYYINSETSSAIGNDSSLSDYSDEYKRALNNSIKRIGSDTTDYDARYFTFGGNSSNRKDTDYTGGKLYTRVEATDDIPYNYMYTVANGSNTETHTLAWPLIGAQSATSVQSKTYEGNLYAAGYRLYYMKDGATEPTYIAEAVNNKTDPAAYNKADHGNIPLYDHYSTRLDEMKTAAGNLVSQIAESATEDNDHRIAVVGFTNTGSIKTGNSAATALVSLMNGDTNSDTNKVNDAVDSAIDNLSFDSSNASKLAKGLETANSIFAADEENDGSRKRVVIVFTDAQPNEEGQNDRTDAKEQGAIAKDTYNASLVAVGICIGDDDADDCLDKLSSNYFTSTKTGNPETKAEDGIQYYFNDSSRESLNTDAMAIAELVSFESENSSLNTSVALNDTNSVLKDIISNNFNVPGNPTVTIRTWDGSYNETEERIDWDNDSDANGVSHSWDSSTQTLSIAGFDYNNNYVSEDHDGKKIVVTIHGLTLKNGVQTESDRRIYSNEKESGIYKTGAENTLFAAFPRPFVDNTTNLVPKGSSGIANDSAVVNKYLTANENGNYDLTLEAYSTAKNEATSTTEKIPTDFIVVVDQSGSMEKADMPTGTATKNDNVNLETVATGSYYYYDEAADQYYKVYGVKDYLYRYFPANSWFTGDIVNYLGADIGWFMSETDATTNIDNAFYFREVVGGKTYYLPIKTTIEGKIGTYYMRFQYPSKKTGDTYVFDREVTTYSSNGNSPWYKNVLNGNVMSSGALWSTANVASQTLYPEDDAYTYSTINLGLAKPRTGMYINYPMYGRHLSYTKLCYRDVNGVEHVLSSNQNNGQAVWEFCDDQGIARSGQDVNSTRPTYSNLYTFDTKIRRIEALQAALGEFAEAVANETDSYGSVDNKVSIVGFSGGGESTYQNTELLTGTTFTIQTGSRIPSNSGYSADGFNHNGKTKSAATAADYAGALVSATNGTVGVVNGEITEAINAITAYGGTQPEDGLDMAYNVLANRSTTQYTIRSGDKAGTPVERNTVVIFFTDGQPGDYHYSNQYAEANDVVESAKVIKESGASIFSIGVFGESDGNPLTYADTTQQQSKRASWKYLGGWMETYQSGGTYYCLRRQWRPGNDDYTETANDTIYDYMSVTSSNYPDAEDYIAPAWLNGTFNGNYIAATDGDTVRKKSTAENTNKYYRMASNQDTLVEAFLQAITMNSQAIESDSTLGPGTILRDILKNGTFKMSSNSSVTMETVKGKADRNGVVTFENDKTTVTLPYSTGSDQIEVTGFDYAVNSIYYGKPEDEENGLTESQGRKLVVTLTNVVPNETITSGTDDSLLYSNEDDSGLWKNVQVAAFPKPAITRHSYTMDVGDANKAATFAVTTTLVAGSGASDDLSDVILVKPDGTRVPYNAVEGVTFNMSDGQTFYFENVPQGYSVKTTTKAPDSFYTYTFWDNDNEADADTLSVKDATHRTLGYSDNVLHVRSVSSYRTVTIAESVSGDYANDSDVFSVNLTLTKQDGDPFDEDTITLADGIVLERKANGKYEGTLSNLPGNQEETVFRVPANWTLSVDAVEHDKYDVETGYPKYNTKEDANQVVLPNEGVVITSDLTNIFVNNISKPITVEGILENNHNKIIYILAGAAVLSAGAGVAYLYRKKDEFVE